MGLWYILALILGIFLYVRFTFFNKSADWRTMLSIQLPLVGLALIAFAVIMLTPLGTRLVDLLFS